MTNRVPDELLNAKLDRELDASDAAQLEALLERDAAARDRAADYERLARVLEELNEPAAPPGLLREVMDQVAALDHPTARAARPAWVPRVIFEGGTMAKKAMLGLAAAAAVVLIVFAITGYPPIGSGTAGTVGAAKRAQAPQIAAQDVVVGDTAVQQFLQSETFSHLINDPNARKLLSDSGFRADLAKTEVRAGLAASELQAVYARADLSSALAKLSGAFKDADLAAAFGRDAFRADLGRGDLAAALKDAGLQTAMARGELQAMLADANLAAALKSTELEAALQRADIRAALASSAVGRAMADASLAAALRADAFQRALASANFGAALGSPQFVSALQGR
jgi:hypothetical protein